MRLIYAAAFLALMAPQPKAQEMVPCEFVAAYARTAISGLQYGVPLADLIEATDTNSLLGRLMADILLIAYKQPRYSAEEDQARAIMHFSYTAHEECLHSRER